MNSGSPGRVFGGKYRAHSSLTVRRNALENIIYSEFCLSIITYVAMLIHNYKSKEIVGKVDGEPYS